MDIDTAIKNALADLEAYEKFFKEKEIQLQALLLKKKHDEGIKGDEEATQE